MDFVENVGRRSRIKGDNGDFIHVGIFSLNGYERNALYRNLGNGRFFDTGYVEGADRIEDGRGLGFLDVGLDGSLDILLNNYLQPARLLVNRPPPENHWIRLRLQGTKSNRSAIGARVVAHHGARKQFREVSSTAGYLSGQSLYLHFGLALDRVVDQLTIYWPSGDVQQIVDVPADQLYDIVEGKAEAVPVQRPGAGEPPPPEAARADG